MNTCPACSQPVSPNELTCPKCGISLHPGTASAGPASGGGQGLSVVVIVVMGLVGIILVLGCLVSFGWFLLPGPVRPPGSPSTSFPAGSTVMYEEDVIEAIPDAVSVTEPLGIGR
jgi:hypothetical protein